MYQPFHLQISDTYEFPSFSIGLTQFDYEDVNFYENRSKQPINHEEFESREVEEGCIFEF